MRGFFAILLLMLLCLVASAVAALMWFAPMGPEGNLWITTYASNARTPLFSAFITLGSSLQTLKTAILQRLKDAYDSPSYQELYLRLRVTAPNAKYYGSLERLSIALALNIGLSFLTAALQLTLGFTKSPVTIGICLGFPAATILLVFYLSAQMFLAHREWFKKIETEKQESLKPAEPR